MNKLDPNGNALFALIGTIIGEFFTAAIASATAFISAAITVYSYAQTALVSAAGISKNANAYVGKTHVYAIINKTRGTVHKIGESAAGFLKDGKTLQRTQTQIRKLYRETGDIFEARILKEFSGKASARLFERNFIKKFRNIFGKDTLPGNLNGR